MQHPFSKTGQRSRMLRWMAGGVASVALALGIAGPASAWPWADDRPKLTNQGIDFGVNWDGFGAPLNGGELHWHYDVDGNVRPHLVGNMYLNNASGTTARMQIDYYDAAHNLIETEYGGDVTAPDNALHVYNVDLDPFEADNVYHVHVSTTTETGTPGVFQVVGTAGFDI
jgi:hypothetical protein